MNPFSLWSSPDLIHDLSMKNNNNNHNNNSQSQRCCLTLNFLQSCMGHCSFPPLLTLTSDVVQIQRKCVKSKPDLWPAEREKERGRDREWMRLRLPKKRAVNERWLSWCLLWEEEWRQKPQKEEWLWKWLCGWTGPVKLKYGAFFMLGGCSSHQLKKKNPEKNVIFEMFQILMIKLESTTFFSNPFRVISR